MQIKINEKILSIPPYISTSWSSISAIQLKNNLLCINLRDGNLVTIPELHAEIVELIFSHHATYLETHYESNSIQFNHQQEKDLSEILEQGNPIVKLGISSMDGIANAMQHNPLQSDAPDLPPDVLQKIAAVSKILNTEDMILPRPEPLCNCFHCQIARVLNPNFILQENEEEAISNAELNFQQWNIAQTGEKLFSVVNRLDINEMYNVYLGQPVGCTCGKQGCEHIIAVLKS